MKLRYLPSGRFRILQFTDTHIGNIPHHEDDFKTFALIKNALEAYDPDLIVHTGDIIWSEGVEHSGKIFKSLMKRFNDFQIPIMVTWGNHDAEEFVTRADLNRIFEETVEKRPDKNHVFFDGDREAYTVEILDPHTDQVRNVLYALDSGTYAPLDIGTYDWNTPRQVEWFRKTSAFYRKGDGVKRNIVFQHMPLPEYWQAANHIQAGICHETNEMISAPHLNTGLFANMVLDGETWGMAVGHDHENDFDGLWQGLHLVYGRVSGFQTYGAEDRGVRIFDLDLNKQNIQTYTVVQDAFM